MPGITIDIIDALLHPSLGRNAEEIFKAIALPVRVHGLFEVLSSLSPQDVSRFMLACVLIRRDISSLGVYVMKNSEHGPDVTKLLEIMLPNLLNMMDSTGIDSQVHRLLGHVVAEVCSVLSLLDFDLASSSVSRVWDKIADPCSKADKSSLDLMCVLTQRAPFCMQKTDAMLQIIKNAVSNVMGQSQQLQLNVIRVILDIMCHVGVGLNMIESCPTLSNNLTERMVQMIQIQAMNENNPENLKINFNSSAAMIGKFCLPSLFQMLHSIASVSHNEEDMEKVMQSLSQISSICPVILASDGEIFHNSCKVLLLLATHAKDNDVRLIALEAIASLISVPDIRKLLNIYPSTRSLCIEGDENNGFSGMVKLCSSLICIGISDDVDEWANEDIKIQDDLSDYEHDNTAIFAESILETFLQNIGGGNQCLQAVLSIVEPLLASQSWLQVRGGLSLLEICLKSSPHAFSSHVPTVVEAAIAFASNPCVRVQFQAIQLLSTLCIFDVTENSSDESGSSSRPILNLRSSYGSRILDAIAQHLGNSCAKVVCHACMAISSYCTGGNGRNASVPVVNKDYCLPSLGDLITKIANGPLSLDISTNIAIFIRSFSAIACLASVAKEDFVGFYGYIMPGLMSCISFGLETDDKNYVNGRGNTAHDIISLRGSAIEAATIVGSSVSSEDDIFHQDAQRIMHIVLPLVQCLQIDMPQLIPQDQMFAASARISTVLGDAFKPYLPSILPHLLSVAKLRDDASIIDGDDIMVGQTREFDEDTGMESITLNLPGMGVKKLILNTSQMQEKSQAARAIYEHANALGASFGPYVEQSLDAFVPLITFQYSSEVRATSAQAVSQIFDSACQYAISDQCPPAYKTFLDNAYGKILQKIALQSQMEEDCENEILVAFSDAISTVTFAAFSNKDSSGQHIVMLQQHDAAGIVGDLIKNVQSSLHRRGGAISELHTASLDEDQVLVLQETLAVEAEFLTGVIDSIGYTLKSMKFNFLPIFEAQVAPFFAPLLNSNTNLDTKARFGAICLFDDCVEHLGDVAAAKYSPMLAPAVVAGIEDEDTDIKEASVYGIIQIARYCPMELQPYLPRLVEFLHQVAEKAINVEKDDVENLRFVENSASALATLSLFPNSRFSDLGIPKSEILRVFVGNLPIQMDYDEAKICHEGLCSLIETGVVDLKSNAKELLNIFGMVAFDVSEGEEVASESTCKRMSSALYALQSQVKPSDLDIMYTGLSPEAQSGINLLFGN